MRFLLDSIVVSVLLGCGASEPQRVEPPRNVVLVVVDTLRADRLGAYGARPSPSPHIDQLASEGIRYDRAIAQAPWTTPSFAALMTSRFPSELGIRREAVAIPDDALLLPEVLREHGLRTGAIVSHDYVSSRLNFDQGFDEFDDSGIVGPEKVSSPHVTSRGLAFLDAHADEPFFLLLHYFDPHSDYVAIPGHGPTPADAKPSRLGTLEVYQRQRRGDVDDAYLAELLRHYDTEIAYTDRHLGELFDRLRELGHWDDTLVVLTADHGEEFMDHGAVGHGRRLYEEVVRVPLIVKHARGPDGVVSDPVALVDVFPTVLDALRLPARDDLAGEVLVRPGESGREGRIVVSETRRPQGRHRRAAIDRNWKLIATEDSRDGIALFELSADPEELRDLSGEQPERVRALSAALDSWFATLRPIEGAAPVDLTPAERRRLKKLGYLRD